MGSMTTDAPSDPNAALWASIRPPPPPSWHHNLRERAAAFSLPLIAERIGSAVPPWVTSRMAARHWLSSTALGLTLGLGLGIPLRLAISVAADGPSASASLAPSPALATSAGTMVAAVPGPPAVVPSPDTMASASAEAAQSDVQPATREPTTQLDGVQTLQPRGARAKPTSKARAQRIAAAKKRARAAAHRRATDRRATRSARKAKPSSSPRTIAAYLRERAQASRVAKYTPR
jgi:hypothetical protein